MTEILFAHRTPFERVEIEIQYHHSYDDAVDDDDYTGLCNYNLVRNSSRSSGIATVSERANNEIHYIYARVHRV